MENSSYDTLQFYRDGQHLCVETRHVDADDFLRDAASGLATMIGEHPGDDWYWLLGSWLPQIVEISCRLKGYKADVVEERLIRAGDVAPKAEYVVHRSGSLRPDAARVSAETNP